MNRFAIASLVTAAVTAAAIGQASFNHNFNSYAAGDLVANNGGYGAADLRTPGANPTSWWNAGNTATTGSIVAGTNHLGAASNLLALQRRVTTTDLDGVIAGVTSPRLAQSAGESSVASPSYNNQFQFSYWFRTASTAPVDGFRVGTEAWGNGSGGADRFTWNRFVNNGGSLTLLSGGETNTVTFPADVTVATGLTWGAWYRVNVNVQFNDTVTGTAFTQGPTDDNDVVTTSIYDASGMLVGSATDTTWESGFRYEFYYPGSSIFGVDSIAFQARAVDGTAFDALQGVDVAYIDGLSLSVIPTPGAAALLGVAGLAATRRRR